MDYTINDLKNWNESILEIVKKEGLDCYLQEFEIISYEDMLCYESYLGMPSHYPHWSYGKLYEIKKTRYKYNIEGLPYEMVINSNPCIAYLMKENTLLLQILTIAHVYGHNDFFKNNRLFKNMTLAKNTVEMFKVHSNRIRNYISDPSIGYDKVERILDAGHSLKLQAPRTNIKQDLKHNIIKFIIDNGRLSNWEKDILEIVYDETTYFVPQIETKIMNEGWASFWHYKILKGLGLPQNLYLEFITRHNQVIRPILGNINPYYIGYKIFEDVYNRHGKDKIFEIREIERDESFIRKYLTFELCDEMNLFEFSKRGRDYIVDEVSDENGWKNIRNSLASSVGLNIVPYIYVEKIDENDSLILIHEYDGRELNLKYAYETLKHINELWQNKVCLKTVLSNKEKIVSCDNSKKITLTEL